MPVKKNDATSSEKMLALFARLLFSGRKVRLGELADELDCSKQTVLRLLAQIERSNWGAQLVRSRNGKEMQCEIRRSKTPRISLNAEGLEQLALCRNFILHLLPTAMRQQVDATLQQASVYAADGEDGDVDAEWGQSLFKGRIDYTPFQDMLQTLTTAIRSRKVCTVTYRASAIKEEKSFDYAPKRLLVFHEAIYVNGWVVDGRRAKYGKPTPLALQRLLNVASTQTSAAYLPDPPEERGETFGLMDRKTFTAKIRFEAKAVTYVAERQWSAGQRIVRHKNGRITLTFQARSPAEVIAWTLSFGDTAEVLSPAWLREKVAEQVAALAGRYATTPERVPGQKDEADVSV